MKAAKRLSGYGARWAALAMLAPYPLSPLAAQDSSRVAEAQTVLSALVESYGVSGAEGPVRETVKRLLPGWVKTDTDSAGNLWVRLGQGDPVVVFVSHLDEIGFLVDSILGDGTLTLRARGGFFHSLFEGQAALVHTARGDVPGIFLPRDSAFTRHTPPPLRVIGSIVSMPPLRTGNGPARPGKRPARPT